MDDRIIGTDVNQVQILSLSKIRGQQEVVDLLKVNLDAYWQSRQIGTPSSFGPVMLAGPSGCGKSLLARAINAELANLHMVETNGEMLSDARELISILLSATSETTIFVDECQGMSARAQHILLTALSEKKVYVPKRASTKTKNAIPLEPCVFIFATTHEGYIQTALLNRVRVLCRCRHYSQQDLIEIIRQRAFALKWDIESEQVLTEIAGRSKKTPRIALNRNLQMAWNVCSAAGRNMITVDDVAEAFRLMSIDSLGLDEVERNYLRVLSQNGPTALNVISSKLALPGKTVKNVIEPYLLMEGLICKEKNSHRAITPVAEEHLRNNNG
jgi:Holliday junction DNA helicase RuvB